MATTVKNKKRGYFSASLTVLCVILAVYTVILLTPLLWAFYTSFIDYNKKKLRGYFLKEILKLSLYFP